MLCMYLVLVPSYYLQSVTSRSTGDRTMVPVVRSSGLLTGPTDQSVRRVRSTGPVDRSGLRVRSAGPVDRSGSPVRSTGPVDRSGPPVRSTGRGHRPDRLVSTSFLVLRSGFPDTE